MVFATNVEFSDKANNSSLCAMIDDEACGKPVILMGDFNYIDWATTLGQSQDSQEFINHVEDNHWTQHVAEGTCNGSILDLVLTSDPVGDHLDRHGLVRLSQHGFRKGGCCLNNLLMFLDKVTNYLDNKMTVLTSYS